jgi:enamine deaminase RidA (YjgF/YER057c/UK114 family)
MSNTLESDVNTAETVATQAADLAALSGNPAAVTAAGAVQAVDAVTQAVEAAVPHNTAIAAIGAGVQALSQTPIVAASPQAASLSNIAASFFAWLKTEFGKL